MNPDISPVGVQLSLINTATEVQRTTTVELLDDTIRRIVDVVPPRVLDTTA